MKKGALKVIGVALILVGAVFLFNSFQITGFTILQDVGQTAGSFLGIALFIGGILLLNASRRNVHDELSDIVDNFNSDKINPVKAAMQTRDTLHSLGREINGVRYKGSEQNVTVMTPQGAYSLRANNKEHAAQLALGLYEIALINDPKNARNCELHLSKKASTKHHREGFYDVVHKFEETYKNDLASART